MTAAGWLPLANPDSVRPTRTPEGGRCREVVGVVCVIDKPRLAEPTASPGCGREGLRRTRATTPMVVVVVVVVRETTRTDGRCADRAGRGGRASRTARHQRRPGQPRQRDSEHQHRVSRSHEPTSIAHERTRQERRIRHDRRPHRPRAWQPWLGRVSATDPGSAAWQRAALTLRSMTSNHDPHPDNRVRRGPDNEPVPSTPVSGFAERPGR
jgi:hypothetical protein